MMKPLAVLFALVSSIAHAGELTIQRFALPNHQTLVMPVPDAWQYDLPAVGSAAARIVRFHAKTGSAFEMELAPSFPESGKAAPPAARDLRLSVERMAKVERAAMIDHSPAIRVLKTGHGAGYYFSAALLQPRSGHFRHLTRGAIPVGNGMVAFTLLSDANHRAIVDAALLVLGDSRTESAPAH
jgi:hypothetical protein